MKLIQLVKENGKPIWINSASILTVEPLDGGRGSVITLNQEYVEQEFGETLNTTYGTVAVKETPSQIANDFA